MGNTNFTAIPDPGNSASSQQATLLALTAAVRVLQSSLGQITGDGITGNSVLDNIYAAFGNASASITIEQKVRADALHALAEQITTLKANFDSNKAIVVEEFKAFADKANALAQYTLDLTATVNDNTAAITNEETARASADEALATDIETLTATSGDNTAQIEINASAIADINGVLSASYGVTLDVNGYQTGFNLLSTGVGHGSFNIRADLLTMVIPGYGPQPVMVINTINGVPTLTFNGNIIGDNTTQNNAYANGSLGSSGTVAGTPAYPAPTSGNLTIAAHGRRAVLLFISTTSVQSIDAVPSVNITANGVLIHNYTPSVTPNPGGGGYLYYATTHMFSHTPGAGNVTYNATVIGGPTLGGNMQLTLTAIELGA